MNQTTLLFIIILCLIMSAYFSATETAFSTCNKIRLKTLADKGSKKARMALKVSEDFDTLLSTILIGNNIVNILCASLSTILFIEWVGAASGPSLSTAVLTIVVLIFGEISPKSIAKEHPEQFAMFSAPLIRTLSIICKPVNFLFKQWKKLLSLIFKPKEEEKMMEEELISMVKEAEEEGELNKEEGQIIKSAIEFTDLEVGDIFTPRVDVTAIDISSTVEEIAQVFAETGYSRIPVYKDTFDNVLGILHYKDFYNKLQSKKEFKIKDLLKPVLYVTPNQKINDVLKLFQRKQLHFGMILDEFGSVAGIVTLEDVLEEIVGEIWDEYDEVEDEINKIDDNEYLVSGKTSVVKLFNVLEVEEEVDSSTVNGFVMENVNGLPNMNSEFVWNKLNIKVTKMDGKRIGKVKIIDNRNLEEVGVE